MRDEDVVAEQGHRRQNEQDQGKRSRSFDQEVELAGLVAARDLVGSGLFPDIGCFFSAEAIAVGMQLGQSHAPLSRAILATRFASSLAALFIVLLSIIVLPLLDNFIKTNQKIPLTNRKGDLANRATPLTNRSALTLRDVSTC